MSDVKLTYDTTIGEYDVRIVNGDLERDDGLETAVAISLFSERRATADEITHSEKSDRRGWWADETLPDNDQIGSLLWLLERGKITAETLNRAKQYAEDALAWIVADMVAESVIVTVARSGIYGINFEIQITQPKNVTYLFTTTGSGRIESVQMVQEDSSSINEGDSINQGDSFK